MTRLFRFLRSTLPADVSQLAIIVGLLFLFIAPGVRWVPQGAHIVTAGLERGIGMLSLFAIRFSASLGFLVCFRPATHPARRLLLWVCIPAGLGAAFMTYIISYIEVRSSATPIRLLLHLGPGVHFALLGLLLISFFTLRLVVARSSLPLALPASSICGRAECYPWSRVELLLWLVLGLLPALNFAAPLVTMVFVISVYCVQLVTRSHVPFAGATAIYVSKSLLAGILIITIAILVLGKQARRDFLRAFHLPEAEGFGFAIAFPIGIASFAWIGEFLLTRLHYWYHPSRQIHAAWIGFHFNMSRAEILVLFIAALSEEMLFRGLLQPAFVRRYGLFRGVYLIGVSFALWHLSIDYAGSYGFTDALTIQLLCSRFIEAMSVSFVLAWLTIQSGSVLPAVVAHGLFNVFVFSNFPSFFLGGELVVDFLWATLAYLLFRYWPVDLRTDQKMVLQV